MCLYYLFPCTIYNVSLVCLQVMEGAFVCAALQDQYKIYDYNNGAVQDLFPFDSEHLKPIITQISRVRGGERMKKEKEEK
jgi:hypothetical protein